MGRPQSRRRTLALRRRGCRGVQLDLLRSSEGHARVRRHTRRRGGVDPGHLHPLATGAGRCAHRVLGDGGGQRRGSGQREQEASDRWRGQRSVSVARRHPRRKAPRMGEGAERQVHRDSPGRSELSEGLRRHSQGDGCDRPHPLRRPRSPVRFQLLAGRAASQGSVAAHEHRGLRERGARLGHTARPGPAGGGRARELGVEGRGMHALAEALPAASVARRRRCGGGARVRSGREGVREGRLSAGGGKILRQLLTEDAVLCGTDFGPGSMTASGYPRIVKLWKRGEPLTDARVIYEGRHDDVGAQGVVFHDAAATIELVQRDVSFFSAEYRAIAPDGSTRQLPLPLGADLKGAQGHNLIFTLREDWTPPGAAPIAKGSLIAYRVAENGQAAAGASVAVLYTPDARSAIDEVAAGRDAVYASIYHDVTGSIHVFRAAEGVWRHTTLTLPAGGSTHLAAANACGPEAQFRFESYTLPTTLYADAGDGRPVAIKSLPARFDASGLMTEQFFATSRDGTQIPYFVTRSKTLAGPASTVLYGYGGFEVSETPSYSPNFGMLWLSRGGVFVVANIRGGGEYGPAWHQAALLQNRQKAYDDFQAVAQDSLKRGITTPRQLGIMGGSNGGLLVSANMLQRPELFGAVVCQVPLIDMIRYTHIGAGASWAAEYGDPARPADRGWIMKYSPYQNVKAGKRYPPVFFVTATSDDRVTPVHARKMAARMEAQGHEVLFYENTDGGHAAAANHKQAGEMWALSFVYLTQKLGPG